MIMSSNTAINVIDEGCVAFYDAFKNMPRHIRARFSFEMLRVVFDEMVKPSINHVRKLDRGDDVALKDTGPSLKEMMNVSAQSNAGAGKGD